MSDASDSNAIPPELEGPVPRDGSNEQRLRMKSVHLNLKCTFLCTIWLIYICLILCLSSWIKQKNTRRAT